MHGPDRLETHLSAGTDRPDMSWREETFRVTVVLLAASLALLVPGTAGIDGSLSLGVVFLGGALVLFAGREQLAAAPQALGHDLGSYGRVLWAGPVVATVVVVFSADATAAELQALGGLVGLAGMANYFLRPLYRALGSLADRLTASG
jgi:hypothetical protein